MSQAISSSDRRSLILAHSRTTDSSSRRMIRRFWMAFRTLRAARNSVSVGIKQTPIIKPTKRDEQAYLSIR
jgi:hypothetical protein